MAKIFNVLLTGVIAISLSSQAYAQKVSLLPSKKKKASIDQQILAQAQSLQGSRVKIYSDDTYKSNSKRTAAKKKATKNTVAQSGSAMTFGPSNTVDFKDSSTTSVSTELQKTKPADAAANKLNGSVAITVGQDSNLDLDREGVEGGFFEMKPSLSYEGSTFSGSFSAGIKDFSKQENSAIAKETKINADVAAKFSLTESISTKSKLSFENSDVRWPDYIGGSAEGMPIRYFESKFTQSLDMKLNRLSVGVNGSYSNRDFSTTYSDFAGDVLGTQGYQRDLNDAKLDAKFDLAFNDNLSLIAKPALKHRKYKDEPARQTNGQKGGAALAASTPVRENLTNELAIDLKASLGAFTITPTATIGQDVDRALGAEDTSFNSAGISLEITLDKDTGLKLGGSANKKFTKYDNWTEKVQNGELREDEFLETAVGASVNLSKSVSLGIDYAREEAESNTTYSDTNYNREIIGSTITVSF